MLCAVKLRVIKLGSIMLCAGTLSLVMHGVIMLCAKWHYADFHYVEHWLTYFNYDT